MLIPLFFYNLRKCNNCSFFEINLYELTNTVGAWKKGDKMHPLGSFFRGMFAVRNLASHFAGFYLYLSIIAASLRLALDFVCTDQFAGPPPVLIAPGYDR